MKSKAAKRILSLLLAAVMLCSLSVTAFAEGEEDPVINEDVVTEGESTEGEGGEVSAPVISFIEGSGRHEEANQGQVTFQSDSEGEYYYRVLNTNEEIPSIDTTGEGSVMVAGENRIILTGIEALNQRVYVVAKNDGGVSEMIQMDLPDATFSFSFWATNSLHSPGKNYAITKITVNGVEQTLANIVGTTISYSHIEAGSEVRVWLGNLPNVFQKLEDVFLYLGSDELNSRVRTVIYNDNSFSFIMPADNVIGPKAGNCSNVQYQELVSQNARWEYYYLTADDPTLYTLEKADIELFQLNKKYQVVKATANGEELTVEKGTMNKWTIKDVPKDSNVQIWFKGCTGQAQKLKDVVLILNLGSGIVMYDRLEMIVNDDNSIVFTMPGVPVRSGVKNKGIMKTLGYSDWIQFDPLTSPTITYVIDSAKRLGKASATLTYESSVEGTVYYGFTEDVNTEGEGAAAIKGENTLDVTGLTSRDAATVYIKVKDAEGNITNVLAVEIPAYTVIESELNLEAVESSYEITEIKVDDVAATVTTNPNTADNTVDYSVADIPQGSTVTVTFGNLAAANKKLTGVALQDVTDITISNDGTSFTFTMPGTNVVGDFKTEWNDNWYKIEDSCAVAAVVGATLTLEGQIGLNFKLTFNEAALADEGAYVQYTFKNATGKKLYIKDAPTDVKDGVTRYVFTQTLAAKEMTELVTIRVYNGDGTLMKLTNSAGTELANDEGSYSVAHYTQQVTDDTKPLAQAMANYGAYAMEYFKDNYTPVNPDPQYAAAISMGSVSGSYNDLAGYKALMEGTLPEGIKVSTISLNLESETDINVYLTLTGDHQISEYTFALGTGTVTPETVGDRYRVVIQNIAAKELDTYYTLKINDCNVKFTALSYAYSILKTNNDDNSIACNMVRALKAYNEAANAYFGN